MTEAELIDIARETIMTLVIVSAPPLLTGLVIGLAISIIQTITQIQEMTLTFVPKIVAIFVALLLFFPWIMDKLLTYTANILTNFPQYIH